MVRADRFESLIGRLPTFGCIWAIGEEYQQPRQMPLIIWSSAAFSWLIRSLGAIRFFSEGTSSARGWRCPTGASGNTCQSELVDVAASGFRKPAACATAAEVSTRASNAIV